MPSADEIRALSGADVSIRLSQAAGGRLVEGRVVGTLEAADGLSVVIQPADDPVGRVTCHYQHIDSVERR
jgi:hypothetical protein